MRKDKSKRQPQQLNQEPQHHSKGREKQSFGQILATELSKEDQKLLKKFRSKMNKLQHVLCPVCNESCPSIVLVEGKCRQCYSERIMSNRFSVENNMNPGEIPEEFQDLMEIEEMLISKAFT